MSGLIKFYLIGGYQSNSLWQAINYLNGDLGVSGGGVEASGREGWSTGVKAFFFFFYQSIGRQRITDASWSISFEYLVTLQRLSYLKCSHEPGFCKVSNENVMSTFFLIFFFKAPLSFCFVEFRKRALEEMLSAIWRVKLWCLWWVFRRLESLQTEWIHRVIHAPTSPSIM